MSNNTDLIKYIDDADAKTMYLEDLIERLKDYSDEEKKLIIRAYAFARKAHKGQIRKSGEEYIIHPIAVACILAEMHADADTVAAGLLHDTVEDTKVTIDDIKELFNPLIASLVDGVTKIKSEKGINPNDIESANMHKIVESLTKDVRIFIIKLADRLHNMRTMEYQTPEKQIKKSKETLSLYVPFANYLGEYHFKLKLEDYSFMYLHPKEFVEISKKRIDVRKENRDKLDKVLTLISLALSNNNIDFDLKLNIKSIYELYKRLIEYGDYDKIHDLFMIKILVKDKDTCYKVRNIIENLFNTIDSKRKDYIALPKTNKYQGLHSTIISDDRLIQIQIKTPEMYEINAYGITAYWNSMSKMDASKRMQDEVKKMQFYPILVDLLEENDNNTFCNELKKDILSKKIYVKVNGNIIEIPLGATLLDLAYYVNNLDISLIVGALVNGVDKNFDYVLKNKDEVKLILDNKELILDDKENLVKTDHARRKILRDKNLNK